jgi:Spy/CpxP family protein refolding chaperone
MNRNNQINYKRVAFAAVAALLMASLVAPVAAFAKGPQDGDRRAKHTQKRAKFIAKMKQKRAKILRGKVGLSEKKAQRVEQMMDTFHKQRRTIKKSMRASHKELRALLKGDSNDQAAYKRAVDTLVAGKAKIETLKRQQINGLRKVLTPKEQAKAMMAVHRMKRHMHRFMRKMHRQRRGPDGKRGKRMRGERGPRAGGAPGAGHAGFDRGAPAMDGPGGDDFDGPPPHDLDGDE